MSRTPLDTLLAERLRSARGLGWEDPEGQAARPSATEGRSVVPAWFRITAPAVYHALRSLGFARG